MLILNLVPATCLKKSKKKKTKQNKRLDNLCNAENHLVEHLLINRINKQHVIEMIWYERIISAGNREDGVMEWSYRYRTGVDLFTDEAAGVLFCTAFLKLLLANQKAGGC